jgi:hypothetical protein
MAAVALASKRLGWPTIERASANCPKTTADAPLTLSNSDVPGRNLH